MLKKPHLSGAEYLEQYRESGKLVVGTFVAGNVSFIIPDNDRLPQSMEVKAISDKGQTVMPTALSGLKVVARFNPNAPTMVDVIEVLGASTKIGVDVLSIIRSYNLFEEFSNEAVNEAKVVAKITAGDISGREDWRERVLVTVDPEDAKDLDDAVGLETNNDGTYELSVHIADVSHFVREGGQLEAEAFARGTSVYFPGGVLPMLPKQLSNNICSLLPNEDRLCLACIMTVSPEGKVLKSRIAETVIKINTRFSYNIVQRILDGDVEVRKNYKKLVPMLEKMAELTKVIEAIRQARGEVILDMPEPKIILDENGKIADVVAYPHELSHRIIETFMVLANETIAGYALEHNLPFVYRIHEKPDPMKAERLSNMLRPFGLEFFFKGDSPSGHDYQRLLRDIDGELKHIVSSLALRSMQKAKYSPDCIGHFGLGSKHYCHFTSPIRRYPDLVIHRILKEMLHRKLSSHRLEELHGIVKAASEQSTKTELAATEVEREVDNLKKAQYMQEHIGEEFSGTISGIADFGVFVYLPNTVEGLVRIENLPKETKKEYYRYNEGNGTVSSPRRTFKMGDKIDVVVAGVNITRRQIEFTGVQG